MDFTRAEFLQWFRQGNLTQRIINKAVEFGAITEEEAEMFQKLVALDVDHYINILDVDVFSPSNDRPSKVVMRTVINDEGIKKGTSLVFTNSYNKKYKIIKF